MAEPIWALGLMSGTSMDGIDAAFLRSDGTQICEFGPTGTFDAAPKDLIAPIAQNWRAYVGGDVGHAERVVDDAHIDAAKAMLARHHAQVIGYHGQTVGHDPAIGLTWQLGQGARLAKALGCRVIHDFRRNDMTQGGQGAPLAPFFHFAAFRSIGAKGRIACVNLGGVANVTLIDLDKTRAEDQGAVFACDTGPANALIDDLVEARTGKPFDRDGQIARSGKSHLGTLDFELFPYLRRPLPKSLDRYDFHAVMDQITHLSFADQVATLTEFTAACIARTSLPWQPERWFICGGGRQNAAMMAALGKHLSGKVQPVEAVGLNGDMFEAQAFAYLAVRSLYGQPITAPGTTGCRALSSGGVKSEP